MTIHRTIRVALSPEQARDLVERSFDADGGWSLSQRGDDAFAHPRDPCEYLLDPPQAFAQASVFPIPEILAVRVSFRGTDDGTEVRARIVRHRIAWLVGAVTLDLLLAPFATLGLESLRRGASVIQYRRERAAAKRRMLRLAIEPLLPHELGPKGGPFRADAP